MAAHACNPSTLKAETRGLGYKFTLGCIVSLIQESLVQTKKEKGNKDSALEAWTLWRLESHKHGYCSQVGCIRWVQTYPSHASSYNRGQWKPGAPLCSYRPRALKQRQTGTPGGLSLLVNPTFHGY